MEAPDALFDQPTLESQTMALHDMVWEAPTGEGRSLLKHLMGPPEEPKIEDGEERLLAARCVYRAGFGWRSFDLSAFDLSVATGWLWLSSQKVRFTGRKEHLIPGAGISAPVEIRIEEIEDVTRWSMLRSLFLRHFLPGSRVIEIWLKDGRSHRFQVPLPRRWEAEIQRLRNISRE
jgi:hypothetical protein